jgi:tryptophanyl-tRNA synthetase
MTEQDHSENLTYDNDTFAAAVQRSKELEIDIQKNPKAHRVLTGDRPTGDLHIGHLFGSLMNRVRLANLGVESYILIPDYQVLTDHDVFDRIRECTLNLMLDYLSVGLNPDSGNVFIFCHSCVPELNQLMLPFLTLVSVAELERNPTVKEEIEAAKMTRLNAGMLVYPVHQAADILSCKGDVVPVGKDQLPHIELTRQIARRFNAKYSPGKPIFPEPQGLLSRAPTILGLDGSQKMSKSRNNSIALKATEDETAKIIKTAKTDSERMITYDPAHRPEVANLIDIASLASGLPQEKIAADIGNGGAGKLKQYLTESLNTFLRPIRARRAELEKDMGYVKKCLDKGNARMREVAGQTLNEVRDAMNMYR